jgi:hypothetical protein
MPLPFLWVVVLLVGRRRPTAQGTHCNAKPGEPRTNLKNQVRPEPEDCDRSSGYPSPSQPWVANASGVISCRSKVRTFSVN